LEPVGRVAVGLRSTGCGRSAAGAVAEGAGSVAAGVLSRSPVLAVSGCLRSRGLRRRTFSAGFIFGDGTDSSARSSATRSGSDARPVGVEATGLGEVSGSAGGGGSNFAAASTAATTAPRDRGRGSGVIPGSAQSTRRTCSSTVFTMTTKGVSMLARRRARTHSTVQSRSSRSRTAISAWATH
jgi:hypothetical protein